MTKEEYLEYWNSMSHAELVVRAGLYIDRINALETAATEAQARIGEYIAKLETALSGTTSLLQAANARITELEANAAKQEKLLQTYVGLAHSWTALAHGQADSIAKLDAEIDRLRQQELGVVDLGDDKDDDE